MDYVFELQGNFSMSNLIGMTSLHGFGMMVYVVSWFWCTTAAALCHQQCYKTA